MNLCLHQEFIIQCVPYQKYSSKKLEYLKNYAFHRSTSFDQRYELEQNCNMKKVTKSVKYCSRFTKPLTRNQLMNWELRPEIDDMLIYKVVINLVHSQTYIYYIIQEVLNSFQRIIATCLVLKLRFSWKYQQK